MLPALEGAGSAVKGRLESLTSNIVDKVNPIGLVSGAIDTFKGQLFSEIPELGTISSSLGDFASDLKSAFKDIKNRDNEESEKLDGVQDKIEKSTEQQQSLFTFLKESVDNVSTTLIDSVSSVLEDLVTEVKTLADITGNVWDVEKDVLEESRKSNKAALEANREEKILRQSQDAQILSKDKESPFEIINEEAKTSLWDSLQDFFTGFLIAGGSIGGMFAQLGKTLTSVIVAIKGFGKSIVSFGKTMMTVAKSGFTILKSITTLGKGLLKATGIGMIPVMIIESVFGAITEGFRSIMSGDGFLTVIRKTLVGALTGPIQGIVDLIDLFFDIPKIDVSDMVNKAWENFSFGELFNNITDWISEGWDKTKAIFSSKKKNLVKKITGIGDMLTSGIVGMYDSIKEWMTDGLKSLLTSFADNKATRLLGLDEKLLPLIDSLFNTPDTAPQPSQDSPDTLITSENSELSPVNRSGNMAASIMSNQNNISDAETQSIMSNIAGNSGMPMMEPSVPINVNNSSTTIMSQRINTRNPDSPMFKKNLGY